MNYERLYFQANSFFERIKPGDPKKKKENEPPMTEHNAHTGVYTVSDLVEKMFGELNKFPLSTKIF